MHSFFHILIFLCLLANNAIADELHLIISGKAFHIGGNNLNENNHGVGFEYDFKESENWIPLITGATFKDSNKQTSKYLGGGAKYRYKLDAYSENLKLDIGAFAFLMTRYDYKNNDPFFAALPFASIGYDWAAINITYAPKIHPKSHAFFYFQAKFKLAEFD